MKTYLLFSSYLLTLCTIGVWLVNCNVRSKRHFIVQNIKLQIACLNPIVRTVCYLLMTCLLCPLIHADASHEDYEPIHVQLEVKNSLEPIYIASIINDSSAFSESYLTQLEKIVAYDFDHNGMTGVMKHTQTLDDLVASVPYDQFGNIADWKSRRISYVIKMRSSEKNLIVKLLSVNQGSVKNIDIQSLTGKLEEDRKLIHKAADTMYKALFGKEGIASTKILYANKTQNGQGKYFSDIWESDYDGANARMLTNEGAYCISPVYLPPKSGYMTGGFMYVSYQIGQPKIHLMSFKDGNNRRLSTLKGNQLTPAISRQRDQIAFISDVMGNPDLFIQPFNPDGGAAGKPYQVFSAKSATQGSPAFSPDGKRLAFVSNKDGAPRIYVINVPSPGTSIKNVKTTLVSKQNRENSAPNWSPDGTKLAYCSRSKGDRQIWMYDFTTNKETQLTTGSGNKENPSWGPDSLHLAFNSTDTNASEIYIINLNQQEVARITSGKGAKSFPCWEPRS